jgi:hypothetical protein
MAHNHGNEYQIRFAYEDGTEELSGWVNTEEQVAHALTAAHRPHCKTYWLRTRSVLCADCLDMEQGIVECTIADVPSPRFSPHDSHYLVAAGMKNRTEVRWWESYYRH